MSCNNSKYLIEILCSYYSVSIPILYNHNVASKDIIQPFPLESAWKNKTNRFDYNCIDIIELEKCIMIYLKSIKSINSNMVAPLLLLNGSYRLHMSLNIALNGDYCCKVDKIQKAKSTYLDRYIGNKLYNNTNRLDRIVIVRLILPIKKPYSRIYITESNKWTDVISSIGREGFHYFNNTYQFIACKDPSNNLTAHFYRLDNKSIINSTITDNKDIFSSAYTLRQSCGNFQLLPSVSRSAMRIGLLLSNTCCGLNICNTSTLSSTKSLNDPNIDIKIIDDIYIGKNNLTDGSGYISYDLAINLPHLVFNGKIIENRADINDLIDLPTAYQCRILCNKGIFKGTLVVSKSINNTIILRKSMLKVNPSSNFINNNIINIEIVNTTRVIDTVICRLNKYLILLLNNGGVSNSIFEYKAKKQMEFLKSLVSCNNASYNKKIPRNSINLIRLLNNYINCYNDNNNEIIEINKIILMLQSDHSITEPYIQCYIKKIFDREIDNLLNFRISCCSCVYLLGIPDPCSVLLSNEVYILTNNSNYNTTFPYNTDVLIARFPILSSENIIPLVVVGNELLDEWFSHDNTRSGGIIVFSTQAVDNINSNINNNNNISEIPVVNHGGDYDGDLYFVCGDQSIVGPFINNKNKYKSDYKSLKLYVDTFNDTSNKISSKDINIDINEINSDENNINSKINSPEDQLSQVFSFDFHISSPSKFFSYNSIIDGCDNETSLDIAESSLSILTTPSLMKENKSSTIASTSSFSTHIRIKNLLNTPSSSLSIEEYNEALFWEFIITSLTDNIGIVANQWLLRADKYGVNHENTVSSARLHDNIMNGRKNGWGIEQYFNNSDNSNSVNNDNDNEKYPHYCNKHYLNSYKSTSVLGHLYDIIYNFISLLPLWKYHGLVLDIDMKCNGTNDFIPIIDKLYNNYFNEYQTIISNSKGHNNNNNNNNNNEDEFSLIRDISYEKKAIDNKYIKIFHEIISQISVKSAKNYSKSYINRLLSSSLYEICYLKAINKFEKLKRINNDSNNNDDRTNMMRLLLIQSNLLLCWMICGEELNKLKIINNNNNNNNDLISNELEIQDYIFEINKLVKFI